LPRARSVIAVFACFVAPGFSVSAQTPAAIPENPLLQQLVGHWRMAGTVRGKPVVYDLAAQRILDNRFVELHMKDVARPAAYEAIVSIGEDTIPGRVLVHWLDSFGAAYSVPYGSGTVSGDTVQFEIPYPERPFRDTIVFQRDKRGWVFRIEASDGHGGWKPFADYTLLSVTRP
jgi:hypothetical protein